MRILLMGVATLSLAVPMQAEAASKSDEQMICKYRLQTGTRFKTKVCKTTAQWDEMAEQNRAGLKEIIDRPQVEIRRE